MRNWVKNNKILATLGAIAALNTANYVIENGMPCPDTAKSFVSQFQGTEIEPVQNLEKSIQEEVQKPGKTERESQSTSKREPQSQESLDELVKKAIESWDQIEHTIPRHLRSYSKFESYLSEIQTRLSEAISEDSSYDTTKTQEILSHTNEILRLPPSQVEDYLQHYHTMRFKVPDLTRLMKLWTDWNKGSEYRLQDTSYFAPSVDQARDTIRYFRGRPPSAFKKWTRFMAEDWVPLIKEFERTIPKGRRFIDRIGKYRFRPETDYMTNQTWSWDLKKVSVRIPNNLGRGYTTSIIDGIELYSELVDGIKEFKLSSQEARILSVDGYNIRLNQAKKLHALLNKNPEGVEKLVRALERDPRLDIGLDRLSSQDDPYFQAKLKHFGFSDEVYSTLRNINTWIANSARDGAQDPSEILLPEHENLKHPSLEEMFTGQLSGKFYYAGLVELFNEAGRKDQFASKEIFSEYLFRCMQLERFVNVAIDTPQMQRYLQGEGKRHKGNLFGENGRCDTPWEMFYFIKVMEDQTHEAFNYHERPVKKIGKFAEQALFIAQAAQFPQRAVLQILLPKIISRNGKTNKADLLLALGAVMGRKGIYIQPDHRIAGNLLGATIRNLDQGTPGSILRDSTPIYNIVKGTADNIETLVTGDGYEGDIGRNKRIQALLSSYQVAEQSPALIRYYRGIRDGRIPKRYTFFR